MNLLSILLTFFTLIVSFINMLFVFNKQSDKTRGKSLLKLFVETLKSVLSDFSRIVNDIKVSFSESLITGAEAMINLTFEIIKELIMRIIRNFVFLLKFVFSIKMLSLVSNFIYLVLTVASVWTAYFLYMGFSDPQNINYYNYMSSLIVSVATMFSILIGFYEFRQKR